MLFENEALDFSNDSLIKDTLSATLRSVLIARASKDEKDSVSRKPVSFDDFEKEEIGERKLNSVKAVNIEPSKDKGRGL